MNDEQHSTGEEAIVHIPFADTTWLDLGDGVSLAPLRISGDGAGTAYLRFDPGARSPAHLHPAGEDLYVVSGRIRVGERVLDAGDFLHTAPGGIHDAEAETAALTLISVPEPVVFIETSTPDTEVTRAPRLHRSDPPRNDPMSPTHLEESATLWALRDRHEAVDALYRFAAGQDRKDRDLFLSAFADDATLDFTEPARRFGADVPLMRGRDAIEGILTTLEPLLTTHTVTNPRVTIDGDHAAIEALVEAQHVSRTDPRRHLLLKNSYQVTAIRSGDRFLIDGMVIRNIWFEGEPSVLFAPA